MPSPRRSGTAGGRARTRSAVSRLFVRAESIDAEWLKANVFSLSPEEAGALWDDAIGPPEVTAVLARLAAEKKIATEAQGKKLTMRLLVPRGSFHGYEGELISGLFFSNRTETDTDAVKQHYRSSGFDPASKIKPGLKAKLAAHPDFQDRSTRPPLWPALWILVLGAAALVLSVVVGGELPGTAIASGIAYLVLAGIGAACAVAVSRRTDRSELVSLGFLWIPALVLLSRLLGIPRDRFGDAVARRGRVPPASLADRPRVPSRRNPRRPEAHRAPEGAGRRARVLRAGARQAVSRAAGLVVSVDRRVRPDGRGGRLVPRARKRRRGRVVRLRILVVVLNRVVLRFLVLLVGRRRSVRRRGRVGVVGRGGGGTRGGRFGAVVFRRRRGRGRELRRGRRRRLVTRGRGRGR